MYGDSKPVFLSQLKTKYNLSKEEEERPVLNRLALHAAQLEFQSVKGKPMVFKAPLPKDLKALLQQLNKLKK